MSILPETTSDWIAFIGVVVSLGALALSVGFSAAAQWTHFRFEKKRLEVEKLDRVLKALNTANNSDGNAGREEQIFACRLLADEAKSNENVAFIVNKMKTYPPYCDNEALLEALRA